MSKDDIEDQSDHAGAVINQIGEYITYARTKRKAGDFETAGRYYVAAARGCLMQSQRLPADPSDTETDAPDRKSHKLGYAIKDLICGSLCFRLAGAHERCRNHSQQGELISMDVREQEIYTASAQQGFFWEVIGDFRLIGELGGHDEAYALAAEKYALVENDLGWSSESMIEDGILVAMELGSSVGIAPDEKRRNEIMYLSLDDRIEFKRNRFPEIIEAVLEDGNWQSEIL